MSIRRRELLVLVSIWLVGCAVVAGLLGLFYLNSTTVQELDQPRPVATFTISFADDTAKSAYLPALGEAQNWQSDVNLVGLSAHWSEATIESLAQAGIWNFRFFSEKRRRIFLAFVTAEGQAAGRAHLHKLRGQTRPNIMNPAEWVVDSDEAVLTWVNHGGGFFLEAFPGSQVEMILRQTPATNRPVWEVIGVTPDQSNFFYLSIDATNGRIVNQN